MKPPLASSDDPGVSWEWTARNETETDLLGRQLGEILPAGTVIALVGNLGAGKTRLTRAIAEGLGADPMFVASPTFVLVHEYEGRVPVYHFDTYRLRDASEFLDLGADEYFNSPAICIVEWADRVAGLLPADHLRIEITHTGVGERRFRLQGTGPNSNAILHSLREKLARQGH